MNNNKGSLAGFTSQRSRLIIWGVIGLVLMSNLGAIIDSFLHPEIEYFDLEHIIVGGATALVFGIMFLMITRYLDRFEKTVSDISQSEKALRESEEKLKTIIETSPDGIATSTLDGKIQFVTEKLVSIFGYASTDELIGRNVMEFVHSSDREKIGLLINELLNGHLTGPAECLLVKKDGSLFYAEANANILCDAGKNPIGILYLERNITERKKAEELLRESEEKFREMAELLPQIVFESDMFGQLTYINKQAFKILGYPQEYPIKGFKTLDLYIPEDRPRAVENIKRRMAGKLEDSNEYTMMRPDGSLLNVLVYSNPIFKENKPVGLRGIIVDITERKQAEEALQENRQRLQFVLQGSQLGYWDWNLETNEVKRNERWAEMLGYRLDDIEFTVKQWIDFIHPDDQARANQSIQDHLEGKTPMHRIEYRMRTQDGKFKWILDQAQVVKRDANQRPIRMSGTHTDITERKQVEEALRASEERYRFLTNNIPDIIYSLDGEGNIVTVNSPAFEHYGYAEQDSKGKPFLNFVHPEDREIVIGSFLKALEEQRKITQGLQFRIVAENGFSYWFELNSQARFDSQGQYIGEEGVLRDITERKQTEEKIRQLNAMLEQRVEERTRELRDAQEQLVRHEKLSVLGQMASSVGHELRNPLAVMTSALYYLRLVQPNADEKIKQYLGMIEQEVRTSEKIISDLLDFARIKSVDREAVSVSDLICRTLERFPVPDSVQSILDIPADLPQVYVDPRQMTQVLGNLVVNSCQAMAAVRSGGKLSIIGNIQNDMINIVVKDNGTGISPENMKKIFDPLFTTKVKGIGLGLAVSQKLVDANGGSIQVESEAGAGSAFTVSLPIHHPGS